MGTCLATHRTSQLHEVLPPALGFLLRTDTGTADPAVLPVQLVVGL